MRKMKNYESDDMPNKRKSKQRHQKENKSLISTQIDDKLTNKIENKPDFKAVK